MALKTSLMGSLSRVNVSPSVCKFGADLVKGRGAPVSQRQVPPDSDLGHRRRLRAEFLTLLKCYRASRYG